MSSRRGGWRQQLAARSRSPQGSGRAGGPLTETLKGWLWSWSWGLTSAAEVVRQARNLTRDGVNGDVHVNRLSACSQNIGNAERVIRTLVPSKLVPTTVVAGSCVEKVILPDDWFAWLQETNERLFRQRTGAKQEGIEGWWDQLRSTDEGRDFWSKHPWLGTKTPRDLRFHVPLIVHDDAGPISELHGAYIRNMFSLVGSGSEADTRYVLSSHVKSDDGKADRSWEPILASFERLARPQADGKWGGVLLFISSDLEYICNDVGLPHYNAVDMCPFCDAHTGALIPFNNFHAAAAWRRTVRDNTQFMNNLRRPLHPLCSHPWFSMYTYRLDLLHLIDHNGVAGEVIGNIVWMHLARQSTVLPGANQEDRMDFLNDDIRGFYNTCGVSNRLPRLKLSNFMAEGGYPELHGRVVKAANTRALLPYVLDLQRRAVLVDPSEHNKHALKVVESLDRAIGIMYAGSYFLSAAEKIDLDKALTRMGQNYQQLAVLASRRGELRWKMKPKLHQVVGHLATQARLVNPRFCHTYGCEGLVGKICQVYSKSQCGPFMRGIQTTVLLKYRTGMAISFA